MQPVRAGARREVKVWGEKVEWQREPCEPPITVTRNKQQEL